MSSDGFPGAIWIPAHADRYARRESRVIEEIVLHITEGGTDRAEITAHNAFGGAKDLQGGKWMAQASHYVVGRNGTVVQCVRHKDIAYHAGPANEWTIGIEHNTRAGKHVKDTKLTAAQYMKFGGACPVAVQQAGLCRRTGITYPDTPKPIPPRRTRAARGACSTGTFTWRPSPTSRRSRREGRRCACGMTMRSRPRRE